MLWAMAAWTTIGLVANLAGALPLIGPLAGLAGGVFVFADPMHELWTKKRVTLADLPRLTRELPSGVPDAVPDARRIF